MKKFYEIIKFPAFQTKNGVLIMFQEGEKVNEVPFDIKRTLVTKCGESSESRGAHTHHKSRQVFMVLSGGCTIELDDGENKAEVKLSGPEQGLLIEPYVWHVMKNFEKNTITLALFDSVYEEKDYIRNYEEFIQCIKK